MKWRTRRKQNYLPAIFASGFTIKATQTGKHRWGDNVLLGKSKLEMSIVKGPLEGALASKARRLGRLHCGPVRNTGGEAGEAPVE